MTPSCVSTFSTPMFNHTSLSILKVLLISFWLPPSFVVLSGSPAYVPLCYTFVSLGHAASLSLFSYIYTNSTLLTFSWRSLSVPCYLPHDILVFCTFHKLGVRKANSEPELSQLLFISIRQRELIRVLTVLGLFTYTTSGWSVHSLLALPAKLLWHHVL